MSEAAESLVRDLDPGPYMAISGWAHGLPSAKRKEIVQIAQDLINAEITLAEDRRVMDRDARRIAELEELLAQSEAEVKRLDKWMTTFPYDRKIQDARRITELEDLLAQSQAEVERLDEWITTYAYDKRGYKI